jgi:phosphate/sulfate permease
MYSKSRNTLTALIAASLFVAGGWMFGHPVNSNTSTLGATAVQASMIGASARITLDSTALRARHASRMNFAMPYYSFALPTSQRRTD